MFSLIRDNSRIHFINELKTKKVIIFGASKLGIFVLEQLRSKNINVKYFCDNDPKKTGKYIQNIRVINLTKLKEINDESQYIIYIASSYYKEISEQLAKEKVFNYFAHEEVFNGFYYFMFLYLDFYYSDNILKYQKNAEKIFEMVSDNISKDVLKNIILHRLTGKYEYLLNCSDDIHVNYFNGNAVQYFDENIIELSDDEFFVDCGAFTGDTINEFIKLTNNQFNKIYAFEPDAANFLKLEQNTKNTVSTANRIELFNAGIANISGELKFRGNNSSSSGFGNQGNQYIRVLRLDDCINEKVTFIKMDIEGMEKEALLGAKEIIKKYKPKLAICIYHRPQDIFEIPVLIRSIVPEYKIYIRHYSLDIGESVCYAVI